MFWVNGMESESLPISDRATQYGDGFFYYHEGIK